MKYQRTLLMSASCFLLALLCSIVWGYRKDENLAERVSPRILRFHVLANSNCREDQNIKIQVKSLLLEQLEAAPAASKEELCAYITEHRDTLETYVDSRLAEEGFDYQSSITVTESYFPTKAYGNLVLPCGVYDTVKVELGEGRGRNWWCVLYPKLCFIDSTHAVIPEESVMELEKLLSREDLNAVITDSPRIRIRFKLLEMLK